MKKRNELYWGDNERIKRSEEIRRKYEIKEAEK